ncbi:sterol 3-beta-glucosyltransferase [Tsukamurella pulmonis]|uniref:UDP:flavonoid glycosyltransferase YjiC, YdhE family n=1 Tax=Tsukamurella pulmonis TaxID=47312 RepID=A0A1H1ERL3_9ACTN|nr:glycosyltransferase [Tsukamurella pulmonis]KXO91834.1 sterol 3-beta-glucosyltransferase [Tsukamurella pulmonis]SDQ91395.1 UDP:flavonoid glycosyltransferase YjiC, YdhE family [Tsukamurella pulmonis]SUP20569.1 Glycosyl transferases, related to UDP-glucuronosyltransferase [Tsukamurella pulmonis]
MAHVLIATYGSRGDCTPLAGVGQRLQRAGHTVTITTNHELEAEIRDLGLDARGVRPDLGPESVDPSLKDALKLVKPAGIASLSHALLDAVGDVAADVVLAHPFAEPAMHAYAEARGIPVIGTRFQPISATTEYPPSLIGAWSAGGTVNRAAGRLAGRTVDRMYEGVVADLRRDLGLPTRSTRRLREDRTAAGWPILYGYSPSVLPRPADWRAGIDVVGYWWSPSPEDWSTPQELADFLDDGPPPVFIGLGSLMVPATERERLSAVFDEALSRARVRSVVQSGGAGLRIPDRADVLNIGAVPYEHVLPRVAAIVHSCGAGTTASALRAGIPTVPLPSAGDQPFWARRLHALGAATAPLPRTKVTVSRLAEAIRAAVDDPRRHAAADALSRSITAEDGAAAVLSAVQRAITIQ